jgi:hypothetical protein
MDSDLQDLYRALVLILRIGYLTFAVFVVAACYVFYGKYLKEKFKGHEWPFFIVAVLLSFVLIFIYNFLFG